MSVKSLHPNLQWLGAVALGLVFLLMILLGPLHNQFAGFIFNPPWAIPVMNTIFFVIIGLIITWLTLSIFLKTGFQGALWLRVGAFTVGLSALSAGWFMPVNGQNFNTTVYNRGVLLASVFYLIGASTLLGKNHLTTSWRKIFLVSIVYLFSLAWHRDRSGHCPEDYPPPWR